MIKKKRSNSRVLKLVLLLALPAIGACSLLERSSLLNQSKFSIKSTTKVPEHFLEQVETKSRLEIPQGMLELWQINREQVEVREGPGVDFELKVSLLDYGENVIITARKGVWRKFLSLDTKIRGWIHYRRLSPLEKKIDSIVIPVKNLEKVFAIRDVNKVYSYGDNKQQSVHIPKGRGFPFMKQKGDKNLVWIYETNSVAWVLDSEVQ